MMKVAGRPLRLLLFLMGALSALWTVRTASAQVDQGSVNGVVKDTSGAIIPGAEVTLTNTDTGLVLHGTTDGSGLYNFSPVKIGHYTVSASAKGFQTTVQQKLELVMQQQLEVPLVLKPGAVSEIVTITTEPPSLQTESSNLAQNYSMQSINTTPLPSRNWVYMAQLGAGITATPGSRGGGSGDFSANGQRPDQNNFLLDGVDNNVSIADYQNGQSYNMSPPPDALAEFQVQTSNYSAEFGHSVGAALSASLKSGSNQVHGDAWEFLRNTNLSNQDWNQPTKPPYHENQFGATLGFPILRNKLFYFGDAEANHTSYASTNTITVPTMKMRQGDFSELLDKTFTGAAVPIQLYVPNSGGTKTQTCASLGTATNPTGNNIFCPSQIDTVAQNILKLYPVPTSTAHSTNNYVENLPTKTRIWQWDQRVDYNATAKDQAYFRYSYWHLQQNNAPPLGLPLDGTGSYQGVYQNFLGQNGMLSETHIFTQDLVNEFRFAYNWGKYSNLQGNSENTNLAASLGLDSSPFTLGYPHNGGLPSVSVGGIASWGTHGFDPSIKGQNVYQILDNLTMVRAGHSLKVGVALQSLRSSSLSPPNSRGTYGFTGIYTSNANAANTGYGVADFLTDQINSGSIGDFTTINFARWYRAAYAQDDWKITPKFTLNIGLRYELFPAQKEMADRVANLVITSKAPGASKGVYSLPKSQANQPLVPAFTSLLASQGISVNYDDTRSLVNTQKVNFAPRLGFAYKLDPKTVIRSGFGIFYGGLQVFGGENLGNNFPFFTTASFTGTGCTKSNCAATPLKLETGFRDALATGLANYVQQPTFNVTDPDMKTPYTIGYHLTIQRAITNNLTAQVAYVGNGGRQLPSTFGDGNRAMVLMASGSNTKPVQPFPNLGTITYVTNAGHSTYNSLQAKLEKRMSHGLSFLSTYTFSHAMDDSQDPLNGGTGYRNINIVPESMEFTNASMDVRHRFNFNTYYELPFGVHRAWLNHRGVLDEVVGGWAANLTFVAQSGQPFSVTPNNTGPAGAWNRYAYIDRNPYTDGGSPDPSNTGITCAAHARTRANWYNPCAFGNPVPGNASGGLATGVQISSLAQALPYLGGRSNQMYGPGYNRVNMSMFKHFYTFREQYVELRADAFNLLNHPTWANPNLQGINATGGQITAPKSLMNNSPDSRFFQLSAKYVF